MSTTEEIYQFKAGAFSSHRRISAILKKNLPGARILELGTAAGFIGRCLAGSGYEITGVEIDASLAEQARPYYHKMLVLDLESRELPQGVCFDALVAADILEHLRRPETVLRSARQLLKDGAQAVISLPNVANIFLRIGLLFGNFNYAERGILDKGHLRFFTLKSARKFIGDCGFKITAEIPTPPPFELIVKNRLLSAFLAGLYYPFAQVFPGLFAYQFIFVAELLRDPNENMPI